MTKLKLIWQELLIFLLLVISLIWVYPKVASAFMTNILVPCITTLIAFTVIGFSLLLFKEYAVDEREELHRFIASRAGYLAGSLILIVGIVWQSFNEQFDPWLVFTLVTMVFVKIASRVHSQYSK
jgi:hypothetical protein